MADCLIVIPAYNEEKNIGKVLEDLTAIEGKADILVVNDGSSDNTQQVARQFDVIIVQHPCNLGYGAALQTGYKYAAEHEYRYVVQFDSDGQHHIGDLVKLMDGIRSTSADVMIGSRFLGDPRFSPGFMKMIAISFFRLIIKWVTKKNITDPTSGLRALSRSVFLFFARRGTFPSDFPDADIILQMLLFPFSIKEIPIGSRERLEGVSMHAGMRPMIYFMKMLLSIFTVLIAHGISKRRRTA